MKFQTKYDVPTLETNKAVVWRKLKVFRQERPETIKGKCHQCGLCALYCPSDCVVEQKHYFEANLDYCKGCGVCSSVCPVHAIRMVKEE